MELWVNVLDARDKVFSYTPRGFLNDPLYASIFLGLSDYDKERILIGFVRYLAVTMRKLLKKSIHSQYYSRYWDPLNPQYEKFKAEHGLSENIWEATGRLVDSISYRRAGNTYIVGIPPEATYPNGTSVLYVAKCMEFGTKNMPARPLFAPVVRYIQRHIRIYWELYLKNPRNYVGDRLTQHIRDFNSFKLK